MSSKLVRLFRVGKQYRKGRYALRNISFELGKGEFAFVTGVSGAGKSTLLKLLFCMEKPTEGQILVDGDDISKVRRSHQYRRTVGFVFQDFKLLPDLTVFENVSVPLDIKKMRSQEVTHRVEGVLSLVGLGNRGNDFPSCLSGGEQQRVAIARSIVSRPSLLLADEPTGNLDSRNAKEIMTLFREIREMGTTVLVATHDEMLMESFPTRTIELDQGLMVGDRGA